MIVINKVVCISACTGLAINNLKKTVLDSIPKKILEPYLNNNILNSKEISAWACRTSPKNHLLWSKLNIGDVAIFYSNSKFVAYSEIIYLLDNPHLGEKLWNDDLYRYIILLGKVKQIDIKRDKFWNIFGYSEKAKIQGLQTPNLKIQSKIFESNLSIYEQVMKILV